MNGATNIPDGVLRQIYAHLPNNCCFIDKGPPGFAAQWEQPERGVCEGGDADMSSPAMELVLKADEANPKRIMVASFTVGACRIPVLIAEYDPERAESFPRHCSLALALAEHGIVIDPCADDVKNRYASPLNLLRAQAGNPRLLGRGKPEEQPEEPAARWLDRFAFGSLDAQFQPWITHIRRWETDSSELSHAHLVSLVSNLSHELGWGLGQYLLACINRLRSTDALRSHLRLIYVEASKALRRRAKRMRGE
jgi:hypothetical protein